LADTSKHLKQDIARPCLAVLANSQLGLHLVEQDNTIKFKTTSMVYHDLTAERSDVGQPK